MPIFDYKCPHCGKIEERIVSIINPANQFCDCGKKTPMRKLESYAPSQFKFKGKWFSNAKEY